MAKKRTQLPFYKKTDQIADAQAARLAGVVDNGGFAQWADRMDREKRYEAKRSAYARLSGTGYRECARRAATPMFV